MMGSIRLILLPMFFIAFSWMIEHISVIAAAHSRCPVSDMLPEIDNHHLHRYPNLYFNFSGSQSYDKEAMFNCSVGTLYPNFDNPDISCLGENVCPLHSANVVVALEKMRSWSPSRVAFERIAERVMLIEAKNVSGTLHELDGDQIEVQVFVFGGSMTAGSEFHCSCFCYREEDARCPDRSSDDICQNHYCTWSWYLFYWLTAKFKHLSPYLRFKLMFYAKNAADSIWQSKFFSFHLENIPSSDYDIWLLDSSTNDAHKSPRLIKESLESLIRQIFYKHSSPTIVLIEQYPFPNFESRDMVDPNSNYTEVYEQLASHYQLLLWSVRDVYWTHHSHHIDITRRYPLDPRHTFHAYNHPPWFVHLFISDLFARCFLHDLHVASTAQSRTATPIVLPQPLYDISELWNSMCRPGGSYLLNTHATSSFKPDNVTAYESMRGTGWREYIDHHNRSGFIINALSDPAKRKIRFDFLLNPPSDNIQAWYHRFRLKIEYLKSYKGVGSIAVFLCGMELRSIDAFDDLHRNGYHEASAKVSVPTVEDFGDIDLACVSNGADKQKQYLEIEYVYNENEADPRIRTARELAKFKLFSIQICERVDEITQ